MRFSLCLAVLSDIFMMTDIFLDRIVDFVAAYFVKLGGSEHVDALVFAGGIELGKRWLRLGCMCNCDGKSRKRGEIEHT